MDALSQLHLRDRRSTEHCGDVDEQSQLDAVSGCQAHLLQNCPRRGGLTCQGLANP